MTERPRETIEQFRLTYLPEGHPEIDVWSLTVEWRGDGLWAICQRSQCLASDGVWDYEPSSSERTKEWRATHRFDLPTALRLAKAQLADIVVNGLSVFDVMERSGMWPCAWCGKAATAAKYLAGERFCSEQSTNLDLPTCYELALQVNLSGRSFTCPTCSSMSYNPMDVATGYCSRCHAFTAKQESL